MMLCFYIPFLEIDPKKKNLKYGCKFMHKNVHVEFLLIMKTAIDVRRISIWWNAKKTLKIMFMNNLNYVEK